MNNKYLTKISSDLSIAEKSKGEEDQAITDYTKRLTKVTNPRLKEALEHALKEERDHSKDLGEAIKELR